MDKIIYWRLDPNYLPRKYQLEDKISKVLIKIFFEKNKKKIQKRSFSLKIKYIKPKYNFNKFKKIDPRWNKILTLINFYQSQEYKKYQDFHNFYIDHDSFINPFLLDIHKINSIDSIDSIERTPSFFIDFKILNNYHKTLKTNFIFNLKNQEIQEEYILYKLKNLIPYNIHYLKLRLNSFINDNFIIHFNTNFIHSFFIKNRKNKELQRYYKNIIQDLKKLQRIYNEKI